MKFDVGDKVSFVDEVGTGIVVLVDGDQVTVEVDGFETVYHSRDLILAESEERKEFGDKVSGQLFSPDKEEKPAKKKLKEQSGSKRLLLSNEINLHMEDLRDEYANMSAGEKLNLQLSHFSEALEDAIKRKEKNVIVIHGVGKGTLRAEVRKILDEYQLSYSDASYDTYGYGATEVFLR